MRDEGILPRDLAVFPVTEGEALSAVSSRENGQEKMEAKNIEV